ncbi:MAG: phospholipase D family protein [Burkholderiales bacterium]|nr:phospholipase D family protein [Burkholderiales bacterium]
MTSHRARRGAAHALALSCSLVVLQPSAAREVPPPPGTVRISPGSAQLLFTPWDDAESQIVAALRGARREVLVQAFAFTSRTIARALIDAHGRGVEVRVTADAGEAGRVERGRIDEIAAAGIPVWLESAYQSAHNKVIVIDADLAENVVITGSYNWTHAAQHRNAENVLILRSQRDLAARYRANWMRHQAAAQRHSPR